MYSVVLICTICFMAQLGEFPVRHDCEPSLTVFVTGNTVVSAALVPISEDFHVTGPFPSVLLRPSLCSQLSKFNR